MYVYFVEFYVIDSSDVRYEHGSEVYDSWDKACKAIDEFKNESIEQGYLVCYDETWENDTRQVKLKDNENYLNYHAGLTKFELK